MFVLRRINRTTATLLCQPVRVLSSAQDPAVTAQSSDEGDNCGKRKLSLSLPTVFLPPELQAALETALQGYSNKVLASDGRALSEFLLSRRVVTKQDNDPKKTSDQSSSMNTRVEDKGTKSVSPWVEDKGTKKSRSFHLHFKYGKRETVAYAAARLPAVYGTTLRVLTEVARRDPSFQPGTLLDFGSGLGASVWAAHSLWTDSLYEYQCVDVSEEMGNWARALRTGGEFPSQEPRLHTTPEAIPGVHFRQYLSVSNKVGYDLVVGAHSLGEVHSLKLRRMYLASLWRKTRQYLVLIEHGNWTGFRIISEARDMILQAASKWTRNEKESSEDLEGHVFAPCPHDGECPLAHGSKLPCHFGQRVQLALAERYGPLRHKGYHLENFSYVVLKKGPRNTEEVGDRILQPTRKRTKHILCKLCTKQGEVKDVILTKSKHGAVYRQCRQSKWGDTLTGHNLTH